MSDITMNHVLDRVIGNEDFASAVRTEGIEALEDSQLSETQKQALVEALRADETGGPATLSALARIADFEPLYKSYSATCTKKG